VIRGSILIVMGSVMVIAVIRELWRIRRLPPKIRQAQRLAQASLARDRDRTRRTVGPYKPL